jgi:aryl-alcohol dehydrogenase-like predicted oxidoreductase
MISTARFGRTQHQSSRTLFGAAALGQVSQAEADAALELCQRHGVNHVDTAASYGESERLLGSWIGRHGRPSFLATKTGERTRAGAYEQIRRSLELLQVDSVDLLQLHNLVEPGGWQTALGPGGALEAAIDARSEGLVRYIGVTGHGLLAPSQHRRALERFDFDSVLFPFSTLMRENVAYWADVQDLLKVCAQRDVAVQTIKAVVRSPWGDRPRTHAPWYEPLTAQSEIDLAVHWVLGHPQVFLNTVGDVTLLPKVFDAAERLGAQPSDEQVAEQIRRLQMSNLFTQPWVE